MVEIDEISSHNGGYECDLLMLSDGLLFGATLYMDAVYSIFGVLIKCNDVYYYNYYY